MKYSEYGCKMWTALPRAPSAEKGYSFHKQNRGRSSCDVRYVRSRGTTGEGLGDPCVERTFFFVNSELSCVGLRCARAPPTDVRKLSSTRGQGTLPNDTMHMYRTTYRSRSPRVCCRRGDDKSASAKTDRGCPPQKNMHRECAYRSSEQETPTTPASHPC